MDIGALDLAIQELKRKAQSSLQNNQLKNGFECARNYLRFDPQDDTFSQEIRSKLVALYEDAANRQLWGCAILLAREANTLQLIGGKEMEQLANEKLAEWNKHQASSATERLQQAKTVSKTLWTQGNLEMTIGNNLPDKGKDTRVTDIGVDAVRVGYEAVHIWWGDDWGFQKEEDEQSPKVRFTRGFDQPAFFFPPGSERDNFFNVCAVALADFRKNNLLSWWSCEITDQGTVLWTLDGIDHATFSPPVNLPSNWRLASISAMDSSRLGPDGFVTKGTNGDYRTYGNLHEVRYPWKVWLDKEGENPQSFVPPEEAIQFICFGLKYEATSRRNGVIPLTIEMAMP